MMGADMSFLSIGSVDESSTDGKASSPQRAAYFSFLMSLASVILCMLLLRQHREAMSVGLAISPQVVVTLTLTP